MLRDLLCHPRAFGDRIRLRRIGDNLPARRLVDVRSMRGLFLGPTALASPIGKVAGSPIGIFVVTHDGICYGSQRSVKRLIPGRKFRGGPGLINISEIKESIWVGCGTVLSKCLRNRTAVGPIPNSEN